MAHSKLCDCYQCELEWYVHELATKVVHLEAENAHLKHLQGVAFRKIRRDYTTLKGTLLSIYLGLFIQRPSEATR